MGVVRTSDSTVSVDNSRSVPGVLTGRNAMWGINPEVGAYEKDSLVRMPGSTSSMRTLQYQSLP